MTNELERTAEAMARHRDFDDFEGEYYVPIDKYRKVQIDLAQIEQAHREATYKLKPRVRECRMWRTVFAALVMFALLAARWAK